MANDLQLRVKEDEDGNLVLNVKDILNIVDNVDDEQLEQFILELGTIIMKFIYDIEEEKPIRFDGTNEVV